MLVFLIIKKKNIFKKKSSWEKVHNFKALHYFIYFLLCFMSKYQNLTFKANYKFAFIIKNSWTILIFDLMLKAYIYIYTNKL